MADKSVYVEGKDFAVDKMFTDRGWKITHDPNSADLVCFTGGGDVSPMLYEHPKSVHTYASPIRDQECCDIFYKLPPNIPTVGICRGAQLLNVLYGGELHQHVEGHRGGPHDVWCTSTGRIVEVTSDHHQMMVPCEDAEVLYVCQDAYNKFPADGFKNEVPKEDVEVVVYEGEPGEGAALCFQPHPEWVDKDHECQKLFFELIDEYLY